MADVSVDDAVRSLKQKPLSQRLMTESLLPAEPDPWQGVQKRVLEDTSLAPSQMALGLLGSPSTAMFLGPARASFAQRQALNTAKAMEARGASWDDIWDKTMWWNHPQVKWLTELSDAAAKLRPGAWGQQPTFKSSQSSMTAQLEHPEYFARFPEMAPVSTRIERAPDIQGEFNFPQLSIQTRGKSPNDILDLLIHEGQHGASYFQRGWPVGQSSKRPVVEGSPGWENYQKLLQEHAQSRPNPTQPLAPARQSYIADQARRQQYERDIGEVMARNAANRRQWSMDTRQRVGPWDTEDVPRHLQLFEPRKW